MKSTLLLAIAYMMSGCGNAPPTCSTIDIHTLDGVELVGRGGFKSYLPEWFETTLYNPSDSFIYNVEIAIWISPEVAGLGCDGKPMPKSELDLMPICDSRKFNLTFFPLEPLSAEQKDEFTGFRVYRGQKHYWNIVKVVGRTRVEEQSNNNCLELRRKYEQTLARHKGL